MNNSIPLTVLTPESIRLKAEPAEIIKAISPTINVIDGDEVTTLIITDINGTKTVQIPHYNSFPPSGVTWGDLFGSGVLTQQQEG